MGELLREVINGHAGVRIRDDLLALIVRLDKSALQSIRDGTKSYDKARYDVGLADGVRLALNLVMELGKPNQP